MAQTSGPLAYLKLIRPKQWLKNFFVFAPLIFAQELFQGEAFLEALKAFAAFCVSASAIYILNDITDLDADRAHPEKRHRPIAAGIIPVPYHWFVKIAFSLRLSDVDCDFRLMRRSVFDRVRLTRSSGVICVELMKKVQDHGFRLAEVPVHHYHRSYGKSEFFNFPRVARTLLDLARLWVALVVRREHLRGGRAARAERA